MTTTAFDDQFTIGTQTIDPVRQPYDTVSILKRNVADLELELKRQTERATHKGATHCDDCGLTWLDDGLNPLGCPYCKAAAPAPAPAPAPAVPAEWREVMTELAADVQAACDAEHPHRDQYPSVMRKYNNDMGIVEKARALLQSAEVQAGDKWNLTPAPTHPVDRNAGEVRHD